MGLTDGTVNTRLFEGPGASPPTPHPLAHVSFCPASSTSGSHVLHLCGSHSLLSTYRCAEPSTFPPRGALLDPVPLTRQPAPAPEGLRPPSNSVRLLRCSATSRTISGVSFSRRSAVGGSSSFTQNGGASQGPQVPFVFPARSLLKSAQGGLRHTSW